MTEKKKKHSLIPLIRLILQHKLLFSGALVSTTVSVMIGFVSPMLLAEMIDHYLGDKPSTLPLWFNRIVDGLGGKETVISNLWILGAILILINILKGVFTYFKGRWCAAASESTGESLRTRLYRHIQAMPYAFHVKAETGDLLQRCTSDVDQVRRFLNIQLMSIVNSTLMITLAIVLMYPISQRVTLWSVLPVPLMLIFSWKFFGVVVNQYRKTEEAEGKMSTVLQENLTGVRVVRAFGQQQNEVKRFEQVNRPYMKAGYRMALYDSFYWTSGDVFSSAQRVIVLVVCVLEAVSGRLTTGELILLVSYAGMLMHPTRQLGRILSDAGRTMVSLERIEDILHMNTEPEEPNALKPSLKGDIVFDHVSFGYEGGQHVLRDLSFTIKQGQTVALLGATGSGKSTLVHLLQRLYEPTSGAITIGGVPIEQIDRAYLRSRIGLVLQEPFLYSKTIRENVGIAVRSPSQKAIDCAARDASAFQFIMQSEKGYDTLVGERGVTLSGGQKQRIAIARTLMKENDIMVFDDSLSAVDTETDAAIRKALRERRKDTTTIIISHRITTLSEADCIFVLENGQMTESGSHEELIRAGGLYTRIYNIQQGADEPVA